MANPYHHSLSSVKKWGGTIADYQPIHNWFDETDEAIGYAVFGVLKLDAVLSGKKSGSRGHARSEHLQVSLNLVKRITLGRATINRKLVIAGDPDERYDLLAAIDAAPQGEPAGVLDHGTIVKTRSFILGAGTNDVGASA